MSRAYVERQILGAKVVTFGGILGLFLTAIVLIAYAITQWRSILYWLTLLALAFCIAVALLAAFEPLYDMMHWAAG
jgi:hypothetical protein